mgnify:CR=1 FL=1
MVKSGSKIDATLGKAFRAHQAGNLREAEQLYRRVLRARPNHTDALHLLGVLAYQAGNNDLALEFYRKVIAFAPRASETHHNMGIVLQALGRDDEAIEAYLKALELRPGHAETMGHLARLCEERNRLEDAADWVARGLAATPGDPLINLIAARLERRDGKTEHAASRLDRLSDTPTPAPIREKIDFELGRSRDRLGDYAKAFGHFTEANRLAARKWSAQAADKDAYLGAIDALKSAFTPAWIEGWAPSPPGARPAPLFMIGFPRSGTTLLEQILNSHPDIRTLEETPAFETLVREASRLPGDYPGSLAALTPDQIVHLRQVYFEALDREAGHGAGEKILVDKLPLNLVQAGPIHRIFPDAKFVLSLRHPCDVCLSCFMQDFAITSAMANFFTVEDAAILYARAMDLWRHYASVLPLAYHSVRYEDLVSDTEPVVRALLEFLGVDWNAAVLDHSSQARRPEMINTPSYHQVAEPIYQRSRLRWPNYAGQLAGALEILTPDIERFGYADGGPAAKE